MDLALAHAIEPRLADEGDRLDPARFAQLVRGVPCRQGGPARRRRAPDARAVTVAGSGARLVGGTRSARLDARRGRAHRARRLLSRRRRRRRAAAGPGRARGVRPALRAGRGHHAARRRLRPRGTHLPGAFRAPSCSTAGVFRAARIAERLVTSLGAWRGSEVRRLADADPDLAVARGAVGYALARLRPRRPHRRRRRRVDTSSASPRATARPGGLRRSARRRRGHPARRARPDVRARRGAARALRSLRQRRRRRSRGRRGRPRRGALRPVAAPRDRAREERPARGAGRLEGELTSVGTLDLACVEVASPDATDPGRAGRGRGRRFRLAFQLRAGSATSRPPPAPSRPPRRLDAALEPSSAPSERAAPSRTAAR